MKISTFLRAVPFAVWAGISGCAAAQVAQQAQIGRNVLQTGHPSEAIVYLMQAAQTDPDYRLPYQPRKSVFTYLGRAYYEIGKDMEAQESLEKALARDPHDHLAHLYLGLTRIRNGEPERGSKEVAAALRGIQETLDYLISDTLEGTFWDPTGKLRRDLAVALAARLADADSIAAAEQLGRDFDREMDEARRDESRSRSRGGGGD